VTGWFQRVWALALAVPLAAQAYVGWFSRYEGDDFCTASIVVTRGFLDAQTYWYVSWSGRFTFTALVSALESAGTWTPQLLPAVAVLAWIAAGSWAVLPLVHQQRWPHPGLGAVVVAELIVFATFTATPNIGQSLYWQTGLLTYTLPLIVGTAFAGWLVRQVRASDARAVSAGAMVLSGGTSFVVGGLSETGLTIQMACLGLAAVIGVVALNGARRRSLLSLLLPGLVGSLLAGAVMLLAPGTGVRVAQEQDPHISLQRLVVAVQAAITLTVTIVRRFEVFSRATFALILVAPAALGFIAARTLRPGRSQSLLGRIALIGLVAVVGFAMAALSLFPVYVVQGFDPPARVQVVTDFIVVLCLATVGYLSGALTGQILADWRPGRARRPMTVLAAGLFTLLAVVPFMEAFNTLGQVPFEAAYAADWDSGDQTLRAARADASAIAVVAPLPPRWGWAFVDTHPDAFPNVCVARFYGLQQVIASAAAPVWAGAPEKGGRAFGG
jgi:hypothetical protein